MYRLIHILRRLIIVFSLIQVGFLSAAAQDDSLFHVSGIIITGNKITREPIILKELCFARGDTIPRKEIESLSQKSRENLLNTSLFNFVTIYQNITSATDIQFVIIVVERWYIWPAPIFEHADRNLGAFLHDPDWKRINYGGQIIWDNFRGRKEYLKLKLRFGYKQQLELVYDKPNFGKKQQHGLNFTLNQTRQHEVNVYSENNKPVYTRNDNSFLAEVFNPYMVYSYRSSLYSTHSLMLAYNSLMYRDSASHIHYTGLEYKQNPDWFFSEYYYEYDYRDSKPYPLKGDYFRINLRWRELLTPELSSLSKVSVLLNATHHRQIANRFYYNNALRMFLSKDRNEPKAFRTGLGYGAYLRGYELFVIDGNIYGLMINNLKYAILPEQSYNLLYVPWSQFNPIHLAIYANLFFDMGFANSNYYDDNGNSYVNRFLYTGGLGIDFVSYYDQVLRLELSLNREGQAGFFVHTEIPFSRW